MGLIPERKEVNKHPVGTIHELAPNAATSFHVNTPHFHQGSPTPRPAPQLYCRATLYVFLQRSHLRLPHHHRYLVLNSINRAATPRARTACRPALHHHTSHHGDIRRRGVNVVA